MRFLLRLCPIIDYCTLKEALVWVNQRKYPIDIINDANFDSYDYESVSNRNSFDDSTLFDTNVKDVFSDYIEKNEDEDLSQSRLFIALKEGKVKLTGVKYSKLKKHKNNKNFEFEEAKDITSPSKYYNLSFNLKSEEVGAKYYKLDSIKWDKNICYIDNGKDCFMFLVCDFLELLKSFPEVESKDLNISRYNDSLIFEGDDFDLNYQNTRSKSGRRPIVNWDFIHPFIAKRILELNEEAFKSQDALATEVQEHIAKQFKCEVGLSTIKAKLKPYWDIFKSKNKSEN
jgi:hypothetical protein